MPSDKSTTEIKKVSDPADPNRCEHIMRNGGQCWNIKHPGSMNCHVHSGGFQINALKNEELSNYRLHKYRQRVAEKKHSPELKSLRDEVAIARMILEERLNQCQTDMDLILHSDAITHLIAQVERTVTSCHKIEEKLGISLDQERIREFTDSILGILTTELDPESAERVGRQLIVLLEEYTTIS